MKGDVSDMEVVGVPCLAPLLTFGVSRKGKREKESMNEGRELRSLVNVVSQC